jgi:indolepyruvate ferredoxin oxidoreductase, beta subunit
METKSILICGVGGQGIILASDILSSALFLSGFDVKKNEIHGMSQREGAVVSFIRYGKKVHSPVVPFGEADALVSFEKLEALRNLPYLKKDGVVIVNSIEILSTPVQLGKAVYPGNDDTKTALAARTKNVKFVNAMETAKSAGNPRASNVVLLGVLARAMDTVKDAAWEESIKRSVKSAFLESNLKAFRAGKAL